MENELEIMNLITLGGEARSKSLLAMKAIEVNDFEKAEALLKEASGFILEAHKIQTQLLTNEARGETSGNVHLLMVHAQDHLMDSMVVKDLVQEILVLQKKNIELINSK